MVIDACKRGLEYGFTNDFTKNFIEGNIEWDLTIAGKIEDDLTLADGIKKHVGARAAHLGTVPLSVVSGIADTIIGVGAGIPFIFARGKSDTLDKVVRKHLIKGTDELLARPYLNLLRTINPDAEVERDLEDVSFLGKVSKTKHNGWLTRIAQKKIGKLAKKCAKSDNCVKKHVLS
ncbi:MAG: hypothetical protein K940chlam9_00448, partial [Chlamydiae bacterium]|nr:hypothetical protein [Chlamydiota bacterium]